MKKPVESLEDFKARIAQIIGPAPDKPKGCCVRTPEDRGYYPPPRNTHLTDADATYKD